MKSHLILTTLILILSNSCNVDPIGYMGLRDIDNPKVELVFPINESVLSDTSEYIDFKVFAYDLFGIKSVSITVNGTNYYSNQSEDFYISKIPTSIFKEDSNYVFARGWDMAGNISYTDTFSFRCNKSIIVENPIDSLELFDKSPPRTIDLINIFEDTYKSDSNLEFELIPYPENKFVNVEIQSTDLIITPKKYFEGSADFQIGASSGHRERLYSFKITIKLSEPVEKIYIPDPIFREALIEKYGFADFEDDSVAKEDAEAIIELHLNDVGHFNIHSISGIEFFKELEVLDLDCNLNSIDLTANKELKYIALINHQIY